jgi:hypothetical protein
VVAVAVVVVAVWKGRTTHPSTYLFRGISFDELLTVWFFHFSIQF